MSHTNWRVFGAILMSPLSAIGLLVVGAGLSMWLQLSGTPALAVTIGFGLLLFVGGGLGTATTAAKGVRRTMWRTFFAFLALPVALVIAAFGVTRLSVLPGLNGAPDFATTIALLLVLYFILAWGLTFWASAGGRAVPN
jgi:hypothetical protein